MNPYEVCLGNIPEQLRAKMIRQVPHPLMCPLHMVVEAHTHILHNRVPLLLGDIYHVQSCVWCLVNLSSPSLIPPHQSLFFVCWRIEGWLIVVLDMH